MFDCSLRSRGSRFEAAAFLAHSQTKSVSARSLVQDSGARSWARWNPPLSSWQFLSPFLAPKAPALSNRGPNQNDTNLLPGNRLGGPIDVTVDDDRDDWISAGHRMVGKKQHRLAASRNLDRASHDALAGQFLPLFRMWCCSGSPSRRIPMRSLRLEALQGVAASAPKSSSQSSRGPRSACRSSGLGRQRRRRSLVNVGEVAWWRPDRQACRRSRTGRVLGRTRCRLPATQVPAAHRSHRGPKRSYEARPVGCPT